MIFNLSTKDVLELTRAIKRGNLDTNKVDFLKPLADGYSPSRQIGEDELEQYLEYLLKGWGVIPRDLPDWLMALVKVMPNEFAQEYPEYTERIFDGSLYKDLIKSMLLGLLALDIVGYKVDKSVTPNHDWIPDAIKKLE